jgi:methylase of polypeptide subunit release factors
MYLKKHKRVLDIGCGTGALSFIYHKVVKPSSVRYFGIDSNPQAIRSARLNATLQEVPMSLHHFDLLQYKEGVNEPLFYHQYEKSKNAKMAEEIKPEKYDVIISNPPWLVASPLKGFVDSGNYDEKELFLEKLFEFVKHNLSSNKGVFYLVYSDLSQILGLQGPKRIEELCKKYELSLISCFKFEGLINHKKTFSDFDLLKQKAGVSIYEIAF